MKNTVPAVNQHIFTLNPDGKGYALAQAKTAIPKVERNQVLIKIGAVSLNYRDLLVKMGITGPLKSGLVPLSDAAGTVVAVGEDVSRWSVGDRVASTFFPQWREGMFRAQYAAAALGGGQTDGVLAEYIVASQDAVVGIPEHLTLEEAATLPCAGVTAWHALVERCQLKPGQTVLIQGTGGVALFALQIAAAFDARPIVISSSDQKLEEAKKLGAWKTINYREQPEWDKVVMDLTDGEGANHVLELGGPETFARSVAAVSAAGSIAQIGVLTGFTPQPNLLRLQFVNANIHGITVGSASHFDALNTFLAKHAIKPFIGREFAFDEAPTAYDYLRQAQHLGKIVIRIGS